MLKILFGRAWMKKEKIIRHLSWWRSLGRMYTLADETIRILGVPVTSAAIERMFSTVLSPRPTQRRGTDFQKRTAKLTYLSDNWKLMNISPPTKPKHKVTKTSGKPEDEGKGEDQSRLMWMMIM